MKYQKRTTSFVAMMFLLTVAATAYGQASGALAIGLNRIEGRVTDPSNNGVYNAFVELTDNLGALINRSRTTGQGRFSFRGMGPGRYTISIKPYGTNLREDSRDIEINNSASRSDMVMVDIRLQLDTRFNVKDTGIIGTIFAQEVPPDARRQYDAGIDAFSTNKEKAMGNLEEAVRIFPTYFNALAALGKANIVAGKYAAGYPYLLKAIDVNARCSDCYYSLTLAFYRLNEMAAAKKAIDATALLQPREGSVRLLQGIVYRLNRDYAGAEKALLLAKSYYKEPNAEVHWQLSHVYNRLNRNAEAAAELEQYLKIKDDINDSERTEVKNLIAKLRNTK